MSYIIPCTQPYHFTDTHITQGSRRHVPCTHCMFLFQVNLCQFEIGHWGDVTPGHHPHLTLITAHIVAHQRLRSGCTCSGLSHDNLVREERAVQSEGLVLSSLPTHVHSIASVLERWSGAVEVKGHVGRRAHQPCEMRMDLLQRTAQVTLRQTWPV